MALNKLPLLSLTYICYHISATSPNPPASRKEISKYPRGDLLSKKSALPPPWVVYKAIVLSIVFCEAIVIVSNHFASNVFAETALNTLTRSSSGTHTKPAPSITPIFLIGLFLSVSGAYIRWSSYRALGRFFTFEISIRDEHKLITTYPYSIVRHPSYTGVLGTFPGVILCLFGPGSWIFECGLLEILTIKIFATIFISGQLYIGYILLARMGKEDKMMKKEFGKHWEEWAKDVPYKLVPGVY